MTDKITDIVIPTLQKIQADIGILKEAVRRIDARVGYMDSYMAGIHSQLRWQSDELDEHRGRIEALEGEEKKPD